jgi:UDP-glucose 6-dehydrogenase
VSDYWYTVVAMNDYQKQRFVERVISGMFNTVAGKRIAIFGFAFKKDTGDTRETPAIDVCRGLLTDGAKCAVYDPQVPPIQMFRDLSAPKYAWDRPHGWTKSENHIMESVQVGREGGSGGCDCEGSGPPFGGACAAGAAGAQLGGACMARRTRRRAAPADRRPLLRRPHPQAVPDPYSCAAGAHAICVLTEWDEFKGFDYQKMYDSMVKPAFIFDGRNILDHDALRKIGFVVYALGKPLDPFLVRG